MNTISHIVCVCAFERLCVVHGALCQIYGPADSPHLREEWGVGSIGEKSAMRRGETGRQRSLVRGKEGRMTEESNERKKERDMLG